jgi:hypothetical protein
MGSRICGHDLDTSLINIGTWISIMTPTHSTKIIRLNYDVEDSNNPVVNPLCLAIFYLPKIWSLVSPYLVQSCSEKVIFTRTVIHYDLAIKLINHMLASGLRYCIITKRAKSISLYHVEGQTSFLLHAIQQVISKILGKHLYDHSVMKWRLMLSKYSFGTRE